VQRVLHPGDRLDAVRRSRGNSAMPLTARSAYRRVVSHRSNATTSNGRWSRTRRASRTCWWMYCASWTGCYSCACRSTALGRVRWSARSWNCAASDRTNTSPNPSASCPTSAAAGTALPVQRVLRPGPAQRPARLAPEACIRPSAPASCRRRLPWRRSRPSAPVRLGRNVSRRHAPIEAALSMPAATDALPSQIAGASSPASIRCERSRTAMRAR